MSVNWGLLGEPADPYGSFQRGRNDRVARQRADEAYGREQRTRSTNEAMAQAIGREDYQGLSNVAAKSGDPQVAQAAQGYRRQRLFAEAASSAAELEEIANTPEPSQQRARYMAWRQRHRARGAELGADSPDAVAQFEQMYPMEATPEQIQAAAAATRARVQSLLNENMTPEAYQENQVAQARLDREELRDERRFGIEQARLDQGERRLEAAIARGGSGGGSQLSPQQFNRANALRDEYNRLTGDYRGVANIVARSENYASSVASGQQQPNSQADIGLVYALAKVYDPTSVVREGEFATVARSGGLGPQIQGYVNRILSDGRLPDQIRNGIMASLRQTYQSQRRQYDQVRSRYEGLASQSGIDPSFVIDDYEAAGAQAPNQDSSGGLPPVSQRVVGQTYQWTTRNGDPAQGVWNGQGFD